MRSSLWNNKKNKLNNSGFTMAELLLVIAIILILCGLSFAGITHYNRTLKQTEMDNTAKELFIAAQNQLTAMQADGSAVKQFSDPGNNKDFIGRTLAPDTPADKGDDFASTEYYVFDQTSVSDNKVNAASMMLPFGSIDDTVRKGGSYIVEYSPKTYTVYGVFYTDGKSGYFSDKTENAITVSDLKNLNTSKYITADENKKSDVRKNRMKYPISSGGTVCVGYYGGAVGSKLVGNRITLKNPTLTIYNGDVLKVVIEEPLDYADLKDSTKTLYVKDTVTTLVVTGLTSGAQKKIDLDNGAELYLQSGKANNPAFSADKTKKTYNVILDDISQKGHHFTELFDRDDKEFDLKFIPGEDITVVANVVAKDSDVLSYTASSKDSKPVSDGSAKAISNGLTNSLYASVAAQKDEESGKLVRTAEIGCMRHLENLDHEVSGISENAGKKDNITIDRAVQINDISWKDYCDHLSGNGPERDAYTVWLTKASENTIIHDSYYPISNETLKEYDGSNKVISDLWIELSGVNKEENNKFADAGLFSVIDGTEHAISIHDLTLRNFDIKNSCEYGNAGVLAGQVFGNSSLGSKKTIVENVVVEAADTDLADAALEDTGSDADPNKASAAGGESAENLSGKTIIINYVSAKNNAGGLIGSVSGYVDIQSSTVSYFKKISSEGSGSAGSYIGSINKANVNIANVNKEEDGTLTESDEPVRAAKIDTVASGEGDAKHAGGIIGSMTEGRITIANPVIVDGIRVIRAKMSAGGIIGSAGDSELSLQSCHVKNLETLEGGSNVGGIAGELLLKNTVASIEEALVENTEKEKKAAASGAENAGAGDSEDESKLTAVNTSDSGAAGGFIGAISGNGTVEIKDSAAAILVSGGKNAGGFIGFVEGNSLTLKISNSYSGGHTVKDEEAVDSEGTQAADTVAADEKLSVYDHSDCNVAPKGSSSCAGGFIGVLKGTFGSGSVISDCYSTCSASADTAGGFVGRADGSAVTIKNSYAAGYAGSGRGDSETEGTDQQTGNIGAFSGTTANTSYEGCSYLKNICGTNVGAAGNISDKVAGISELKYVAASGDQNSSETSQGTGVSGRLQDESGNVITIGAKASKDHTYIYNDLLTGKGYPFRAVTGIEGSDDGVNNNSGTYAHYGDWQIPTDNVTFEGDVAVLYYELVQHGSMDPEGSTGSNVTGYYHGFVQTFGTAGGTDITEIYTPGVDDGNGNNTKGLLTGHNEYVTEDGYIILVNSEYKDISKLSAGIGNTNTYWYFNDFVSQNKLVKYDSICKTLGITGYDAYYIPRSTQEAYQNDLVLKFGKDAVYWAGDIKKQCTFSVNTIFSDIIYTDDTNKPVSNSIIPIRSAQQLNYLCNSGLDYNHSWNNSSNTIQIQMDMSYLMADVKLTECGTELSHSRDDRYDSATGTVLKAQFESEEKNDVYCPVIGLSASLIEQVTSEGVLRNMRLFDIKIEGSNKAIVELNRGTIENVVVDGGTTEGAGLVYENVKTIKDCTVRNLKEIGGAGLAADGSKEGNGKITGCLVENIAEIGKSGMLEYTSQSIEISECTVKNCTDIGGSGFAGEIKNGAKIEKCSVEGITGTISGYGFIEKAENETTITSCKVSGVKKIEKSGFIGTMTAGSIRDSYVEKVSDGIYENGFINEPKSAVKIENCYVDTVHYIERNGFFGEMSDYGTSITGCRVTNVTAGRSETGGSGFGGVMHNGTTVKSCRVELSDIGQYGFIKSVDGDNQCTIDECRVINIRAGKTAFAGTNKGTITSCFAYGDKQKYIDYIEDKDIPFKEYKIAYSDNHDVTQSENKDFGYDLILVGTQNNGNYAGFVENNTGTIASSGFTGTVWGDNVSGFFYTNSGTIKCCYANSVLMGFTASSGTGLAAGFGNTQKAGKLEQNHALSKLSGKTGVGFVNTFEAPGNGNAAGNSFVSGNYSIVWSNTTVSCYPFYAEADGDWSSKNNNNYYVMLEGTTDTGSILSDDGVIGVTGTDLQGLIDQRSVLGALNRPAVCYGQYMNCKGNAYPYPMGGANMTHYGDWPSLKASTDSNGTEGETENGPDGETGSGTDGGNDGAVSGGTAGKDPDPDSTGSGTGTTEEPIEGETTDGTPEGSGSDAAGDKEAQGGNGNAASGETGSVSSGDTGNAASGDTGNASGDAGNASSGDTGNASSGNTGNTASGDTGNAN